MCILCSLQTLDEIFHGPFHELMSSQIHWVARPVTDSDKTKPASDAGLKEIVRYLRNQREVADIKLERLRRDVSRLERTRDLLQSEKDKLSNALRKETEKASAAAAAVDEHLKLKEQMNLNQAVKESNGSLDAGTMGGDRMVS